VGRVGSRKPGILAGMVGLGQDFRGSGRVRSRNCGIATLTIVHDCRSVLYVVVAFDDFSLIWYSKSDRKVK